MNDYIYALIEVESKTKWYIGRTENPARRIKEHRYGAKIYKEGDELKYQYANALDRAGIEWDMLIVMECGPDTEFYEDYFVNLFRDSPLQNMRAGESEPWMGKDYSSPEAFVKEREQCLKKLKAPKIINLKRATNSERTRFFGDYGKEKLSPALQEMMDKRKKT